MNYLNLLRFPNLLIVAFTQYLLQYTIILPYLEAANLSPILDTFHFFLLVLTTVLIAAGGYVINDIVDYPIDIINKPEKTIINCSIAMTKAKNLYYGLSILGLSIAFYLAWYVNNLGLVLIYPFAVLLLWFYAHYFKKQVLLGNAVVALFCAFVAGILLFAERAAFFELQEINAVLANRMGGIIVAYGIFAFIATLYREVIKDMEDVEGDRLYGCQTLPIVVGLKKTKIYAVFLAGIFLLFLLLLNFWFWKNQYIIALVYCILAIIAPLLVGVFLLKKAQHKQDFKMISHLAKWKMLAGLLLLLLL